MAWEQRLMLHFEAIASSIPFILGGVPVTLCYTFVSIFFGLILGAVLAWCKLSSIMALRCFGRSYTSVFRGTPLLFQLGMIYFAIPQLTGVSLPPFVAGIMAFSLNSAAYVSEIIRGGIEAVDQGQRDACLSLDIPPYLAMRDIIIPQALRYVFPALVNEMINLLKESALISVIGEADLMRRTNMVSAEKYLYFEPMLIAGGCYYGMVLVFSTIAKYLERQLYEA